MYLTKNKAMIVRWGLIIALDFAIRTPLSTCKYTLNDGHFSRLSVQYIRRMKHVPSLPDDHGRSIPVGVHRHIYKESDSCRLFSYAAGYFPDADQHDADFSVFIVEGP